MIRVQNGDSIKISSFSSKAGVVLKIYGQILLPGGKIIPFQDGLTTTATRLEVSKNIPVTNGYLISISVGVSSGSLMQAQCFIKAEHQLGVQAPYTSLKTLFSDYITTNTNCTFPGSPLNKSFSGPGFPVYTAAYNQPIGESADLIVPVNAIFKMEAIRFFLTTSADIFNREACVYKAQGNNAGGIYLSGYIQPSSTLVAYYYQQYINQARTGTYNAVLHYFANLGELVITQTDTCKITQFGGQGTDTLTNITFQYNEWINI